jgi:chromosome partitioning protein
MHGGLSKMQNQQSKQESQKTNNTKPQKIQLEAQPYMLTPTELADSVGITQATLSKQLSPYQLPPITGKSYGVPPKLVREYLEKRGFIFEKRVISHMNMRGGIGKTTSTISTASRAAQFGYNVLIIDLDSQGSASQAFKCEPENEDGIFMDVWNKGIPEIKAACKKIQSNLWILPSSLENGLLDNSLSNPKDQKNAVGSVCAKILSDKFDLMEGGVDLIFIDCPPSLGSAIISTICASDTIVVPVQSDAFSVKGLKLVFNEIKMISDTFQLEEPEIKILYTAYDGRKKQSIETMSRLVKEYSQYFCPTFIRSSAEFDKAIDKNETVFASPRSSVAKEDYDMYFKFLLNFGQETVNQ